MSAESPVRVTYQWLLDFEPSTMILTSRSGVGSLFVTELVFAAGLAAPPVVRATGIPAELAAGLVALHFAWCALVAWHLRPVAERSPSGFHTVVLIDAWVPLLIACLLPVLGRDPRTPLWMLPVLYAAMNGAILDSAPSRVFLLSHALAPLATIPLFALDGGPWRVAGPLLCAASSGATYHFIAARTGRWRAIRAERDEALKRLQLREAELQRVHLARDLHDSVGSALGLLAVHSDLVERHAEDPDQVRRLAQLAREAAREGLGDLRGVLEAIAPPSATVEALAAALRDLAARQLAGTGVNVRVESSGQTDRDLDPPTRLALVRTFQESVRNAVAHGGATNVSARLAADAGGLSFEIQDDGRGFDPARVKNGRGLAGMRARAEELGGTLAVESRPGQGARVVLTLPFARAAKTA